MKNITHAVRVNNEMHGARARASSSKLKNSITDGLPADPVSRYSKNACFNFFSSP